jgi:hypothetical protein
VRSLAPRDVRYVETEAPSCCKSRSSASRTPPGRTSMSTFELQIISTDQSTPRCPNCAKPMRFTRSIPALGRLAELQRGRNAMSAYDPKQT